MDKRSFHQCVILGMGTLIWLLGCGLARGNGIEQLRAKDVSQIEICNNQSIFPKYIGRIRGLFLPVRFFDGKENLLHAKYSNYAASHMRDTSSSKTNGQKLSTFDRMLAWLMAGVMLAIAGFIFEVINRKVKQSFEKTKDAIMVSREEKRARQTGTQAERDAVKDELVQLRTELARTQEMLRKGEIPSSTDRTPGTTKTVMLPGGENLTLVWCPPGEFIMGSPENERQPGSAYFHDSETQHKVKLTQGFWIGKYPVTQSQWKSVMGANPSRFKSDNFPVECVSWKDCQSFLQRAGCDLRLPTEAEWEYACRAGSTTAFSWGNDLNGTQANCNGSVFPFGTTKYGPNKKMTMPVGSYKGNAWGIYDMHGNVHEWCADWYGSYSASPETDPKGPASGDERVTRGGSWKSMAFRCRSAARNGYKTKYPLEDLNYDDVGFRICQSEV